MNDVFADTFYFVAMLNWRDQHHKAVCAATRNSRFRIVTTSWVLVEVADALCPPPLRGIATRFVASALSDTAMQVVAESEWLDRGLDLFGNRSDKSWSLTDCISFSVMTDRRLTHALTGDRHFSPAGFVPMFAASQG